MQALDQRVARADLGADLPDPAHSDDSHLDRLHRQAASLQSRGRPSNVLRIRRNGMPLYAIRIILVVVALLTGPWPASAQDFPTKPIELVIPYGPGGSHDLTARAIASVAQQYLGQPLLVVPKPGGGGAVAFGLVGHGLRKLHFEPAPLVLAMILGPQLEASVRRALIFSRGDVFIFFERPISAVLMTLAVLMLLSPLARWALSRKFWEIVGPMRTEK